MRFGSRITALMYAAALTAQQPPPAPKPQGSLIAGTVVDQNSGAPLPRATVRLTLVSGSSNAYAIDISDSSGRFGFSYLPPGNYRLRATRNSYEGGTYGGRKPGDSGVILVIGQNDQRWSVVLRMAKTGGISGTVRDEDGDPLRWIQISLFKEGWHRGRRRLQFVRAASTNDLGQYRIAYLLPGQYFVEAYPGGNVAGIMMTRRMGGQTGEPILAPVFYPNETNMHSATPVPVEGGKEVSGIDLVIHEEKPAILNGRFSFSEGVGADVQVQISAESEDMLAGPMAARGRMAFSAGGAYQLANLMPGSYRLVATAESGGKHYRGVTDVDVGAGTETEASISLAAGIELHGTVKLEGGGEMPKNVDVSLTPGDDIRADVNPQATTRADSSFVIKNVLPGIWDINVKPIVEGGYIKSMMLGDRDVLTEEMLIAPDTSAPLNIVINSRGSKIEGDVNLQGRPGPQQAIVLLAPVGKFSGVLSFYRTRIVDETGHYVIRGIRPGSYRVYAFDEMAQQAYQDPEFLKPFENEGEALTLEEGQTIKINPKLLQMGSQP